MIEDIVRLCGTRLGPGRLYGAIARLEQQDWIKPLPPEERRRPYRITAESMRVLRAKLTTLRQFTKAGLERLQPLSIPGSSTSLSACIRPCGETATAQSLRRFFAPVQATFAQRQTYCTRHFMGNPSQNRD
jgi:hypothetical protein